MSVITYHACDVCGLRLDKGTAFYGVCLKRETVDQGYWSSDDSRWAEICTGCSLTVSVAHLLETFFKMPHRPMPAAPSERPAGETT